MHFLQSPLTTHHHHHALRQAHPLLPCCTCRWHLFFQLQHHHNNTTDLPSSMPPEHRRCREKLPQGAPCFMPSLITYSGRSQLTLLLADHLQMLNDNPARKPLPQSPLPVTACRTLWRNFMSLPKIDDEPTGMGSLENSFTT